jgi:hypothetical protein
VLLHEQHVGTRRVHADPVDAVSDLPILVRQLLRAETTVDRAPRLAAVVRAERSRRGDRHDHPLRLARVDQDRVQAQPTRSWLPLLARLMTAEPGELLPALSPVDRAEERGILDAGEYRVRVG